MAVSQEMASDIVRMQMILREKDYPMFDVQELEFYIKENGGDVNAAIYQCLLLKAEDNTIAIQGLNAADTSSYFRRLAVQYKPSNSGILESGA